MLACIRRVVKCCEPPEILGESRSFYKGQHVDAANARNEQGAVFSRETICTTLQECARRKDIATGRQMHSIVFALGLDSDAFLADHLIRMFASCNCILEANQVFHSVSSPSVFTWNAVITAHIKVGNCETALELFCKMHVETRPDKVTYLCAIKACSLIGVVQNSRRVHESIVRAGVMLDVVIGSSIVNMYCKCGILEDARSVFDHLSDQNEVSWNAIIAGYAEHGQWTMAIEFFSKMQEKGVHPDKVSVLHILKACTGMTCLQKGRIVHEYVIGSGFETDVIIGSSIVDMYAKCGSLAEACKVFDGLSKQDLISYCAMIMGYAQHGQGFLALKLFSRMLKLGLTPDSVTFSSILKACGSINAIEQGRMIHDLIVQGGLKMDVVVGSSILDMYARCGSLHDASKVFSQLPHKNMVSWGAMITGFVQHDNPAGATALLTKMQKEGLKPSRPMLLCILKACTSKEALEHGRFIHTHIAKAELSLDMVIGSTLVDMYAKCGSLEEAYQVFNKLPHRDSVSWGAMISGCAQHGDNILALDLYQRMHLEGSEPTIVTFSAISKACADLKLVELGRLIHVQAAECSREAHVIVGSALVDSYVKCGALEDARYIFDCLPIRDAVSWAVMVSGYLQHKQDVPAFELFGRMQQEGIEPNVATILCVLKACGTTGSIKQGRLLHNLFLSSGPSLDVVIGTTLVEMYAKLGSLEEARKVFDEMPGRTVVSWGVLIAGYAWYGNFLEVQCCLDKMWHHGLKPVDVIFTSILSACNHAGLLEEGCHYFRSMMEFYDIQPNEEHFNCMVDILGRKGCLHEAEALLQTMPTSPDAIVWTSLLNASKTYGSIQLGRQCFDEVFRLDSGDASGYALMSDIYIDTEIYEAADHRDHLEREKCRSTTLDEGG